MLIAAVCGEIEKTQYGEAQGAQYRGYAAGTRYLVSHGGVADMCLLGEPTEGKVVLGHFGALWLRIRVHGNFIHTAFSEGKRDQNSILRMHEVTRAVLEWIPTWEDDPANAYRGAKAIVNVGAVDGRVRLARLAHAAPHRPLPRRPRAADEADGRRAPRGARASSARSPQRFPDYGIEGEVYVTAPGAEIDEGHELVQAIDAAHARGLRRGAGPRRDALVQRRVRPDALRHPDGQLRDVDRSDGRRARRESRHRRARQDGRDVRARRAEDLRDEARHVRRRQGRPHRRRGGRSPRRPDDARVLRARRRRTTPASAPRSPT